MTGKAGRLWREKTLQELIKRRRVRVAWPCRFMEDGHRTALRSRCLETIEALTKDFVSYVSYRNFDYIVDMHYVHLLFMTFVASGWLALHLNTMLLYRSCLAAASLPERHNPPMVSQQKEGRLSDIDQRPPSFHDFIHAAAAGRGTVRVNRSSA